MHKIIIFHALVSCSIGCEQDLSTSEKECSPICSSEIAEHSHSFIGVELDKLEKHSKKSKIYPCPIANPATLQYPSEFPGPFTQEEIKAIQIINHYHKDYFKNAKDLNFVFNKEFTHHIIATYKHFLSSYRRDLEQQGLITKHKNNTLAFPDAIHQQIKTALAIYFLMMTFEKIKT
jgi:hypothetical protein